MGRLRKQYPLVYELVEVVKREGKVAFEMYDNYPTLQGARAAASHGLKGKRWAIIEKTVVDTNVDIMPVSLSDGT